MGTVERQKPAAQSGALNGARLTPCGRSPAPPLGGGDPVMGPTSLLKVGPAGLLTKLSPIFRSPFCQRMAALSQTIATATYARAHTHTSSSARRVSILRDDQRWPHRSFLFSSLPSVPPPRASSAASAASSPPIFFFFISIIAEAVKENFRSGTAREHQSSLRLLVTSRTASHP